MLSIRSRTHNTAFNIATEEYLMSNKPDDCFYLYINRPSIIVGKHQNSLAEINVDYVKEQNIDVVRRMTGGGAVFHDPGNLNFSFIKKQDRFAPIDFADYLKPILDVLKSLGVDAKFEGRNDMTIGGKKFSGNAKCYFNGKVLSHGTLLFSSKLPDLSQALKINPLKYKDKAVKSVRSRVTNISEHLGEPITLEDFESRIIEHMYNLYSDSEIYELTPEDIKAIDKLVETKYGTWDWNFGHSPKYNFQKGIKAPGGHVEVNLEIQKGIIEQAKIFGDFFTSGNVEELENHLKGMPHEQIKIKEHLENVGLNTYIENVTVDELLEAMF